MFEFFRKLMGIFVIALWAIILTKVGAIEKGAITFIAVVIVFELISITTRVFLIPNCLKKIGEKSREGKKGIKMLVQLFYALVVAGITMVIALKTGKITELKGEEIFACTLFLLLTGQAISEIPIIKK